MPWVFDPHSGGVKIPKLVPERIRRQITDYANKKYAGRRSSGNVLDRNSRIIRRIQPFDFFRSIPMTDPAASAAPPPPS